MDNRSICYPYRENVNLIRKFFAKPIVLICAIFGMAYTVDALVLPLIGSANTAVFLAVDLPIGVLVFAETVWMLILYINSRSRKFSTLKTPLTFLRAVSLISATISALAPAAFGFSAFYVMAESAETIYDLIFDNPDLSLTVCGTFAAAALCKAIAAFVWFGSVKKSVSSVYLCRKGSAACAAFSFVSAALLLAVEVFAVYAEISGFASVNAFAAAAYDFLSETGLIQICAAAFAFDFLLAIMAARYNSYIKKHTDTISLEPRQTDESVSTENTQSKTIEHENVKDFTPQSVDFSAMQTEERKICPDCGTQCGGLDKFCPKCGAPLSKQNDL